jgi:hypothetical protein
MTRRLLELPLWSLGVTMVGVAVALTLVGARLSAARPSTSSDALSALHATISTIYTVLLAFVVVIVWQQFSDAETHVETEATRLSNMLRDSRVFDEPDRTNVHDRIIEYIRLASTREWDAMARGGAPDPPTNAAYAEIWEAVYKLQPSGATQLGFHDELLTRLNELGAARRVRLLSARASVPWVLWVLLIGGAVLVIYVSYLLPSGPERAGRSAALAATSCVITLTLFVIFVFDHPYAGSIRVDPSPLTDLLTR